MIESNHLIHVPPVLYTTLKVYIHICNPPKAKTQLRVTVQVDNDFTDELLIREEGGREEINLSTSNNLPEGSV
jgi:hypothetical protein